MTAATDAATNSATDQNNDSNGCGPLFLYYLHSQLHYDWRAITTAGVAAGINNIDP